jgi:hypothetical protein
MPTVKIAESSSNLLSHKDLRLYGDVSPTPEASNFRAKEIPTEEILYGADSCMWAERLDDSGAEPNTFFHRVIVTHELYPLRSDDVQRNSGGVWRSHLK